LQQFLSAIITIVEGGKELEVTRFFKQWQALLHTPLFVAVELGNMIEDIWL